MPELTPEHTPPDDTTREVPCPRWSLEETHPAHEWDAPVDGRSKCPGWITPGESERHRCPNCDHLAIHHHPDGCWYAVTTGAEGRDLVCPCFVPLAALAVPKSHEDVTGDVDQGDQWRRDEREIDGSFSGCEFPRLWPPR